MACGQHEYIADVSAGFRGRYEWTVNFFTTGESEAVLQLKFGPSAWYANEEKGVTGEPMPGKRPSPSARLTIRDCSSREIGRRSGSLSWHCEK
jgi:hypothetical protein